jgi:hypothetical protein
VETELTNGTFKIPEEKGKVEVDPGHMEQIAV